MRPETTDPSPGGRQATKRYRGNSVLCSRQKEPCTAVKERVCINNIRQLTIPRHNKWTVKGHRASVPNRSRIVCLSLNFRLMWGISMKRKENRQQARISLGQDSHLINQFLIYASNRDSKLPRRALCSLNHD